MTGPTGCMRRVVGLACAVVAQCALVGGLSPAVAFGQVIEAPFDGAYTAHDLGTPPGVPEKLGGLTLLAGDNNTLLIGGEANAATGALYAVPLTRDVDGHITGFAGAATRFADAAYNDGGVIYGPGGVLSLARWPNNELGQTKPGSRITDKIIDMAPLGVASSLSGLAFVPQGFPGAGSLKLNSYRGGQWYDAAVSPDGNGTYDVVNVTAVPDSQLGGGPEGYVYVPIGSRQFDSPSMLVSEFNAGMVAAYELDADGNPTVATRRTFLSGLVGPLGAAIDPVTNDLLFSNESFGGGSRVIAVGGFGPLPDPVLGKAVNVGVVKGEVLVGIPAASASRAGTAQKGVEFVPLTESRQIPVGSFLDTSRGTVRLSSARNKAGGTQSGEFAAGVFQVLQSRNQKAKGLTELRLKGSSFKNCRSGKRSARRSTAGEAVAEASGRRLSRRTIRRLRGRAKGRYRTRGRHSSATVRGTTWITADRCDGTLTTVKRGKVAVRDFRRKKTVTVRAGKSYLARAQARPPVVGKRVNVSVVRGKVFVKLPARGSARSSQKGTRFVPLTEARSIPVRSILDTRRGTVKLSSARNKAGETQSGEFAAGVFQVLQSRRQKAKGLTELRLKGSIAKHCRSGKRSARRTIRRLRARARGRFRTRGRHSAATVGGTIWITADRCDGTLTKVTRGKVAVRDFRLKKTVTVRAGKRYLARAPAPARLTSFLTPVHWP